MAISRVAAANAQVVGYNESTNVGPQIAPWKMARALGLAMDHMNQGCTFADFATLEFEGARLIQVREATIASHTRLKIPPIPSPVLDQGNRFSWEMVRSGITHGLALLSMGRDVSTAGIATVNGDEVKSVEHFLTSPPERQFVRNLADGMQNALDSPGSVAALRRFRANITQISRDPRYANGANTPEKIARINEERGPLMGAVKRAMDTHVLAVPGARGRNGVKGFIGAIVAPPSRALEQKHGR